MARLLQILGLLGAVAIIALWFALGADTGWSKTKIAVREIDPVTEIETTLHRDGFVPGVDFLAAGLGGSALLFGVGLFLSRIQSKSKSL